MKLDLKKNFKELYKTSSKDVVVVRVPKQKIISIEGKGNPNTSVDFKNAIEALFPIAYAIKFMHKKKGYDFSVMPLEGFWWTPNMNDFLVANKDMWLWKIFIVQPDFVPETDFNVAVKSVKDKKNPVALSKVKFETVNEGYSAQILYVGPFANEGPTIKKLHDFIKENGYSFDGLKQKHHEIYLSDMRKTPPQKLKTIIRQSFEK